MWQHKYVKHFYGITSLWKTKMNIVSLFSGCGGLDLGFERAGFKVIWANEFDKSIHATYKLNHPDTILNTSDIRSLSASDIPDCDGIIGGPPCQSWSLGGRSMGMEDERGRLVLDYIRIVKGKRPKFFIMENVAGMVSPRHIESFESFLKDFKDIGYNVKYELLNAADYIIPQDRFRVFIVGIRKDINCMYIFPPAQSETHIPLSKAIGDIIEVPKPYNNEIVDCNYGTIQNHDYYTGDFDNKFMARNRIRGWHEVSYTIQAQAKNEPLHPQAPKMEFVSSNQRKFKEGYEGLYRRLSVRECARIQSFPDHFRFIYSNVKEGYKMVGNAVPPRLAFYLAESIKRCFDNAEYSKTDNSVLIGYVKSEKDLSIIRKNKVYYIRGGSRPGAMQFRQLDKPIKWLLLHRNKERYLFELEDKVAESCDKSKLKMFGFSPQGDDYWFFSIKKELPFILEDSVFSKLVINTKKPQITEVSRQL